MFDTGASHNFMNVHEAKRLGLKFANDQGTVKAVNSEAKAIEGVARGLIVKIGDWQGKHDFTVLPMDNFDIVLGVEFFDWVIAIVDSSGCTLTIVDGKITIIPLKKGKPVIRLSAMQNKRGVTKTQRQVVTPKEIPSEEKGYKPTIPEVHEVLEEKDVITTGLPRKVDQEIEAKPGNANAVDDVVSQKTELAAIVTSMPISDFLDKIKEGLKNDPTAKNLLKLAKEGKTRRFWQSNGTLLTIKNRLFVPRQGSLRNDILKECHHSLWVEHLGMNQTFALNHDKYYWPKMQDDIEAYVKTCLVCQQDKEEQQLPAGLLEPLPVAEIPQDSVTMDFIVALPKSQGFGSIMVVVDKFSATFIPCPPDVKVDEAARLFFKNVMKLWGMPKSIINDQDPHLIGKFQREFFKLVGTDLNFSTK